MTSPPAPSFSGHILDPVGQSLPHLVSELSPSTEHAPSLKPLGGSGSEDVRREFLIDGPEDISFRIEIELFSVDENFCDLYVDVEDGDSRHFMCDVEEGKPARDALDRLIRAIAVFVLSEVEQRRIQHSSPQPSLSEVSPDVPLLILDENGTIENLTQEARQVFEHSPDEPIERNFFSHIHGQNLQRVMRDVARMVSDRKKRAQWLLRIRTGNRRWRWCRALAENHLHQPEESIRVLLRPL